MPPDMAENSKRMDGNEIISHWIISTTNRNGKSWTEYTSRTNDFRIRYAPDNSSTDEIKKVSGHNNIRKDGNDLELWSKRFQSKSLQNIIYENKPT